MTSDSNSVRVFPTTARTIDDSTFVIKTFLRPRCAHRLVDSIFAKYPGARTLVADDSPAPLSRANVTVFHLPFDCGVSVGRNYLVDRVQTPFFVMCDVDVVITKPANIDQSRRKEFRALFMSKHGFEDSRLREGGRPCRIFWWEPRTGPASTRAQSKSGE